MINKLVYKKCKENLSIALMSQQIIFNVVEYSQLKNYNNYEKELQKVRNNQILITNQIKANYLNNHKNTLKLRKSKILKPIQKKKKICYYKIITSCLFIITQLISYYALQKDITKYIKNLTHSGSINLDIHLNKYNLTDKDNI